MPSYIKEIAGELDYLQHPVELDGKFELLPAEKLPEFQSPGTLAINAVSMKGQATPLVALICQKEAAPRAATIRLMSRISCPVMLVPIGSGTVVFKEDNTRRYVVIFERPKGKRLVPQAGMSPPKFDEDDIIHGVIENLLPAFRELSSRTLTHRAIRPDNIFLTSDRRAILGEAVSTPAGYAQPVLYEPIDSGMASPSGRAEGTVLDDYYSLGVLIAELAMGGTLLDKKTDEQIIEAKIKLGSYGALVGQSRVPLKLMEPLRGLLSDDPYERWGIADLEMWANGRHLSPKQVPLPQKAVRSISFAGKDYLTAPLLANSMRMHWTESKQLIAGDQLDSWIRRALSNDDMASLIKAAQQTGQALASTGSGDDRTASVAMMALDPSAPITYKSTSVRVNGLAQAIALDFFQSGKLEQYLDIIRMKLPQAWVTSQVRTKPEFVAIIKQLESVEQSVKNMTAGYGMERAVYAGNEGWPCLSPLVGDNYVDDIKNLLPALEGMVAAGRIEGAPVDRHILAFSLKHLRGNQDALLKRLNDPFKRDVYNRASLRFLAEMQKQHSPQPLPALSAHMADLLIDAVETFNNTAFRKQLRDAVEKAKHDGQMTTLQMILDNAHIQDQDKLGFTQAQAMFTNLEAQATWLEKGGLVSDENVRMVSEKTSAVISAVCSGVALVIMTISWVL
ncbi:serine/threonine-protein kinase [Kiloniella laminariae]|uniref:serine/threonine-protein kinase n=1 Tax=Kiloniella laminariae TaxID=454162 RepID=UPI00037EAF88|nr:serine/threonine-protein kinase [Kiloniella laminariae]